MPTLKERYGAFVERLSPRARQWSMVGLLGGVGVGLLWAVVSAGSGDSAQRAASAAKSDLKPTNVDLKAPGAQLKDSELWIGKAGRELDRYVNDREEQRRTNRQITLQATLSVVLLVGAALFDQSLRNVRALRLGFDVDPVVYVYPEQRGTQLADAEAAALRRRLLESARAIPGVERAALGLTVPFWDTWNDYLYVAGIDSVQRLGNFTIQAGSPEFFATIGTRILRGRGFTAEDRAGAPLVAVVSQSMAGVLWPGREALGQCFRIGADTVPCTTVVGIAEDIHQNSVIGVGERSLPGRQGIWRG